MRKNKRNVAEIAVDVELKLEHLDLYLEAAAAVVEELRMFLGQHHLELTRPEMTLGTHGYHAEMPLAADDPQYAARSHRYINGCDAFLNVMRDTW